MRLNWQQLINEDNKMWHLTVQMAQMQQMVLTSFGGNIEAFNAFEEKMAEENHYTLHWQDIADVATILPEFEEAAREAIVQRLGYHAHDCTLLHHVPFISGLLNSHRFGQLTDAALAAQLDDTVRRIRNIDMIPHARKDYKDVEFELYKTFFAQKKMVVIHRLKYFLGYEPALRHSVIAEMMLRTLLADNEVYVGKELTEMDRKALTIIKYREILTAEGKAAADASPLLWGL